MSRSNRKKAGMMKTPERICRLCSTLISHEIYVMENTHKDIVEIILPDVKIEYSDEVFMCEACNKLLQEFFQFKSTCLEIEDTIHNYTLDGQVQVDLEKIIGLNDVDQEKKGKICRMCLEFIESESFSELDTEDSALVQMQQKCLPEMDLLLTKEPVMCDKCEHLLKKCFDFLSKCMDNEEKYLKRMKTVEKVISTPKRNINQPNKRALSLRSHGIDSDSSGEDPDFNPEYESEDISDMEEDEEEVEEPQPKTKKRTSKSSNISQTLRCLYCPATFTSNDQISVHLVQCKKLHEKTQQQNESSTKLKVTAKSSNSSQTLRCLYCPATFASNDKISVHLAQCKQLHEKTQQQIESSTKLKVTTNTSEVTSSRPENDHVVSSNSLERTDIEKVNSEDNSERNVLPDSTNQVKDQLGRYTISSNHRELTILKCDTCEINTRSFLKIEQHVLSHLHRLRFKTQLLCPHCQKKFDSEQEIYIHLKDKHARCNYKMFHWCVSCTKIFTNRKAIACHWKECPRKNYMCKLFKSNQTMFCMLCNYESDDEKEAKAHRDSCQFESKTLVGDTIEID